VAAKRVLGRSLDEILEVHQRRRPIVPLEVEIDKISSNPSQPRHRFDEESLQALAESIRRNGVLQPVLVREAAGGYELIAGERRLRAARQAGLRKIPVLLKQASDDRLLELALVENLQRQDLNPIERAQAYKRLLSEYGLTQEEAARRVGEERSTFANIVRLLDLPASIRELVSHGTISAGHARALLGLPETHLMEKLARRIVKEDLSVRRTEEIVSRMKGVAPRSKSRKRQISPVAREQEDFLRRLFGTKVALYESRGRGKIVIEFFGYDDFDRIMEILRRKSDL